MLPLCHQTPRCFLLEAEPILLLRVKYANCFAFILISVDARDFPVEERVVSVFKIFTRRCCIDSHYKIL